jgi:hypothetical protein
MAQIEQPHQYDGIFGTTTSVRLLTNSRLFKGKKDKRAYVKAQERLTDCFRAEKFEFVSICDMARRLKCSGQLPEIHEEAPWQGSYREYILPYVYSALLDFDDIAKKDWNATDEEWQTRRLYSHYDDQKQELLYNDWFITEEENAEKDGGLPSEDKIAYDIGLLLAIRRRHIFSRDFGTRLYNVVLPSCRAHFDDKVAVGSEELPREILVTPVITFSRKAISSSFRRTFSVSLVVLSVSGDERRSLSGAALKNLFNKKFVIEAGNLSKLLKLEAEQLEVNLHELRKSVLRFVVESISEEEPEWGFLWAQSHNQELGVLKTGLATVQELKDFQLGESDGSFRQVLRETVELDRYFADEPRLPQPDTVRFEKLNVNDEEHLDSESLIFYNPQFNYFIGISGIDRQMFPFTSLKWLFLWSLYMLIGLSAVEGMMYSFYREIEEGSGLWPLVDVENDLIVDMDELYDLDIKSSIYKTQYEKIKKIAGIEDDYNKLKDKLSAQKANENLIQQNKLNVMLIILSLTVIFATLYPISLQRFPQFSNIILCLILLDFAAVVVLGYGVAGDPRRWIPELIGKLRQVLQTG